MKKVLLLSTVAIFALANDKVLIDNDLNQVCSTQKCEELSSKFEKIINLDLNDNQRENRKDYTGSSVSKLKGTWNISYGFGSSKSYSDTWKLTTVEYASSDLGYGIYGTNKNNKEVACWDFSQFPISGNYKFMCATNLTNSYADSFYINVSGDNISGGYEYGTATDSAKAGTYGSYDGSINGSKNSTTSLPSNNNSCNIDPITGKEECENETFSSSSNVCSTNPFTGEEVCENEKIPALPSLPTETETSKKELTKNYLNTLPNGWNLVGTAEKITDTSIFEDCKSVYIYKNNAWVDKSSINSIDEFNGMWIYKK